MATASEFPKGMKAKFFHPRTMGVMHEREVLKVDADDSGSVERVRVRFDICGKSYWTSPDHF